MLQNAYIRIIAVVRCSDKEQVTEQNCESDVSGIYQLNNFLINWWGNTLMFVCSMELMNHGTQNKTWPVSETQIAGNYLEPKFSESQKHESINSPLFSSAYTLLIVR